MNFKKRLLFFLSTEKKGLQNETKMKNTFFSKYTLFIKCENCQDVNNVNLVVVTFSGDFCFLCQETVDGLTLTANFIRESSS